MQRIASKRKIAVKICAFLIAGVVVSSLTVAAFKVRNEIVALRTATQQCSADIETVANRERETDKAMHTLKQKLEGDIEREGADIYARLNLLHRWVETMAHRQGGELPVMHGTWEEPINARSPKPTRPLANK